MSIPALKGIDLEVQKGEFIMDFSRKHKIQLKLIIDTD